MTKIHGQAPEGRHQMVGASFDVAPPGLGYLIMLISGGLHPRLHDVAAPRLEKHNFKKRKRGRIPHRARESSRSGASALANASGYMAEQPSHIETLACPGCACMRPSAALEFRIKLLTPSSRSRRRAELPRLFVGGI